MGIQKKRKPADSAAAVDASDADRVCAVIDEGFAAVAGDAAASSGMSVKQIKLLKLALPVLQKRLVSGDAPSKVRCAVAT